MKKAVHYIVNYKPEGSMKGPFWELKRNKAVIYTATDFGSLTIDYLTELKEQERKGVTVKITNGRGKMDREELGVLEKMTVGHNETVCSEHRYKHARDDPERP